MKILILGHANHGKSTAAEMFCRHIPSLSYLDSSRAALDIFLWERLKQLGYRYPTLNDAYECRKAPHMRQIWRDEIASFNADDPSRLARLILDRADVYVGMRSYREYESCRRQRLFKKVIWIDNPNVKPETDELMDIELDSEMLYIPNDGTLKNLNEKIEALSLLWVNQSSHTNVLLN